MSHRKSEHPSPLGATLGIKFFHLYRTPFDWLVVFIKAFSSYFSSYNIQVGQVKGGFFLPILMEKQRLLTPMLTASCSSPA